MRCTASPTVLPKAGQSLLSLSFIQTRHETQPCSRQAPLSPQHEAYRGRQESRLRGHNQIQDPLASPAPPFNPYCHQRSRHLNPYDLTFPTDSIQSTQTEESFRQPQSSKGDVKGPITSNSGRSSPDRPKNASRNTSVTENASSNVKRPPDELICALQNSELRTFPSTEISAKCVASATPHRRVVGQVIRPQKYPPEIIDQQECPTPPPIYLFRKIYSAT